MAIALALMKGVWLLARNTAVMAIFQACRSACAVKGDLPGT